MEDINNQEITNNDIYNALLNLNESSSATNKSVQELQAYFIAKDKKEAQEAETLKKQQEQEQKENEEIEEQAKVQEESVKAEETAKADSQAETYTEILTDIRDQVTLTNEILSGQIFFIGILCGVLLAKIFIDRFIKL